MAGQSLYKVADLSTVWVEADVYEAELASIRVGEMGAMTVDAYPGQRFSARVIYIYPRLRSRSRANRP
jgi:membrane fusion protein, copper/silver efflux system